MAQNIDLIGREKLLSFSGGVSLSQVYHRASGVAANRDRNGFVANGNLNVAIYGWRLPLSFALSDNHSRFTQPFNQFALHPKWGWLSVHVGNTSMSFSPYTVNGHTFRGVGVDLDPGEKWRFSALYGRLLKATDGDSVRRLPATFQRMGYAMRAAYRATATSFEVILFHARDDEHSITAPLNTAIPAPQQNTVASIRGSAVFFKRLTLQGDIAASAVTRDTRADGEEHTHPLAKTLRFTPATSFHDAVKASLQYQNEHWSAGLGYERIDPGYQTFGAYYFNDDLENITANGTARLAGEKLAIAISAGVQRDNLNGAKRSTLERVVTAGNVRYAPKRMWHLTTSWSSFQSIVALSPAFTTPYENPDTLDFVQVIRSASLSAGLAPSDRRNIAVHVSWQETADRRGSSGPGDANGFANIHASYSHTFESSRTVLAATFQASLSKGVHLDTRTFGPTASVTWAMWNRKVRASGATSWISAKGSFAAWNARLHCVLAIGKTHRLTFNTVCTRRYFPNDRPSIWELTAVAGYQWTW